jgi:dihydrofolate reductase
MTKFIGIVAISGNGVIGKDGKLPWHYPEDLAFFKKQTMGHTVVMGRNSWLPLVGRDVIVLSSNGMLETNGQATLATSIPDILWMTRNEREVYVAGGDSIYTQFSRFITEWYVSSIPVSVDGGKLTYFSYSTCWNGRTWEHDKIKLSDSVYVDHMVDMSLRYV